eukprot:gnl/TRDRNA2_/TRDRNA2_158965_c0_seq1.p1 gnl/TRDRNA2_/TRDRNA2_158965_c0~~gnl/TRDRNA2_/TRDRNA2_158965_c0_seq1.p1  ORF type:complete len:192 (-),score=21.12 gnl/TRDRNA2_/TRDRNA2_158965_c0_seq1:270-845(-)
MTSSKLILLWVLASVQAGADAEEVEVRPGEIHQSGGTSRPGRILFPTKPPILVMRSPGNAANSKSYPPLSDQLQAIAVSFGFMLLQKLLHRLSRHIRKVSTTTTTTTTTVEEYPITTMMLDMALLEQPRQKVRGMTTSMNPQVPVMWRIASICAAALIGLLLGSGAICAALGFHYGSTAVAQELLLVDELE